MSRRFALVIANTDHIDPGLAQLTAPGKDAEDFARVLKDPNLCAFDHVNILMNQLSSTVIEAVDDFFDQKKPDDMLIFYFSGHGVRDESGSLFLAVRNTIRSRLRSTAIRADYIREAMDQSRSKRQVLILDCCNSGAFPQGTKAEVGGIMGMTRAFQGYGRFVLTASDATQFAWEGNTLIGETQNSLFTHFLVKGLQGEADRQGDGRITVDALYDYTYEEISKITPNQTPTKSAARQEGEIVLRQITRLEDIKPVSLPAELLEATEDSRTFVREGAVQQLEKLLRARNLGLARSAREALERMERLDDSRRVSEAATQALAPIRQSEQLALQKAEAERLAKEEAERAAKLKAEEERLAFKKAEEQRVAEEKRIAEARAEVERKAKAETERLLAEQKAEEERISRLKVEKEKAERKAKEVQRTVQTSQNRPLIREEPLPKQLAQQRANQVANSSRAGQQGRKLPSLVWISSGVVALAVLIGLYVMSGRNRSENNLDNFAPTQAALTVAALDCDICRFATGTAEAAELGDVSRFATGTAEAATLTTQGPMGGAWFGSYQDEQQNSHFLVLNINHTSTSTAFTGQIAFGDLVSGNVVDGNFDGLNFSFRLNEGYCLWGTVQGDQMNGQIGADCTTPIAEFKARRGT